MKTSLQTLKGVGEKTEKLFQKVGVYSIESLLHYYPRNYDTYLEPVDISEVTEGLVAVCAAVSSAASVAQVRNLRVVSATVSDESGKLPVVWYNMPYLRSALKKGSVLVFRGKVVQKKGRLQMEHPEIFTAAAYKEVLHTMQPVYALTAGLTSKGIAKLVRQALKEQEAGKEFLPSELKEAYELSDIHYALQTIHFPKNMQELLIARKRLVFDEFLLFLLSVQLLKEKTESVSNAFPMKPVWTTETVLEGLPYQLTGAQMNAWRQIERDLCGHSLMSRLVQGDVGSGKTILAFLAMILCVKNGYQAALMAPTEVLAKQHSEDLQSLCEHEQLDFISPVLLTGSLTAKEKRQAYQKIDSGEANLIIGTHALIQEKVNYRKLGLVITDEQHRFGVRQREALAERGDPPHVLVMSATPIPRTLAIILYGDLDISVIDELPAARLPIKNCVVGTSYRPKAYAFIEKQVREGHQVYVICPMVEESEGLDAENVLDYTEKLRQIFPPDIRISFLHGKMKAKEKNAVMEAFAAGEIQILVSTTVVEVGVNVPNATVMMVENADRFGLAQLHQLRGRVGRGDHQSYCIFIQGNGEEQISKRLEILNKSNDGFFIAAEDLKLRGPGDLFGVRQSGLLEFRLGDIYQDAQILQMASEAAAGILSMDRELELPQHAFLKKKLEESREMSLENPGI